MHFLQFVKALSTEIQQWSVSSVPKPNIVVALVDAIWLSSKHQWRLFLHALSQFLCTVTMSGHVDLRVFKYCDWYLASSMTECDNVHHHFKFSPHWHCVIQRVVSTSHVNLRSFQIIIFQMAFFNNLVYKQSYKYIFQRELWLSIWNSDCCFWFHLASCRVVPLSWHKNSSQNPGNLK